MLYGLGTTIGAGLDALTGVAAGLAGMHAPSGSIYQNSHFIDNDTTWA